MPRNSTSQISSKIQIKQNRIPNLQKKYNNNNNMKTTQNNSINYFQRTKKETFSIFINYQFIRVFAKYFSYFFCAYASYKTAFLICYFDAKLLMDFFKSVIEIVLSWIACYYFHVLLVIFSATFKYIWQNCITILNITLFPEHISII